MFYWLQLFSSELTIRLQFPENVGQSLFQRLIHSIKVDLFVELIKSTSIIVAAFTFIIQSNQMSWFQQPDGSALLSRLLENGESVCCFFLSSTGKCLNERYFIGGRQHQADIRTALRKWGTHPVTTVSLYFSFHQNSTN